MDAIQSRRRHLAKTITWRLIGTVDTVLIGWVVTGDAWIGVQVGGVEMVTKMILYYFHERAWFRYGKLGRENNES